MKTRMVKIVPAPKFQKLAKYKDKRNVLHAGDKKRLNVVWPDGRNKGPWVVMDSMADKLLKEREENTNPRIPDRLLFQGESKAGRKQVGKRRMVALKEVRTFLGMSLEEFSFVRVFEKCEHIDGHQVYRAEQIEKYKREDGKGRR